MSQPDRHRGAYAYYDVLEKIKDSLLLDVNVNTVTEGDITQVNLNKQDIFPLSHIIVNNVSENGQILTFNLSVMAMDIVDVSKSKTIDIFRGNDNEQDVLNTQLAVLNKFLQRMRSGNLHFDAYQLDSSANIEPFRDRFENQVAGWVATFSLVVMNNIDAC
ncbi:MAG: hypothetical protein QNK89_04550 [Lacinutrix sp.]|uniref:hypothetical protein n=1 Tax=Lacinutrix sp. TaxID=1937692 RepID=UPI0030AD94DD